MIPTISKIQPIVWMFTPETVVSTAKASTATAATLTLTSAALATVTAPRTADATTTLATSAQALGTHLTGADGTTVTSSAAATAVITDDATHTTADRFGQITLTAGTYPLELTVFEYNGDDSLELYAAPGNLASYNSSFRLLGDTANGGLVVQTLSGGST